MYNKPFLELIDRVTHASIPSPSYQVKGSLWYRATGCCVHSYLCWCTCILCT